jgi:hypothetical protein
VAANAQPINCWASALADCDQKITREHLVSQCLFESDEIVVQGFPWCLNEPKSIGLSNLVAKILCKRHNSATSELDSAALHGFNVFRESIRINNVRGQMKKQPLWNVKHFEIDGPSLERWFLKTLINLSFGGQWVIGPGSHAEGTPSKELVEIAFGLRQFENGGGLYIAGRAGEQIDSMDRVNVTPMTEANNLMAGRFNFRGYTFLLSLVSEKFDMLGDSYLLYRQSTLRCHVQGRLSHVISIRGW